MWIGKRLKKRNCTLYLQHSPYYAETPAYKPYLFSLEHNA